MFKEYHIAMYEPVIIVGDRAGAEGVEDADAEGITIDRFST